MTLLTPTSALATTSLLATASLGSTDALSHLTSRLIEQGHEQFISAFARLQDPAGPHQEIATELSHAIHTDPALAEFQDELETATEQFRFSQQVDQWLALQQRARRQTSSKQSRDKAWEADQLSRLDKQYPINEELRQSAVQLIQWFRRAVLKLGQGSLASAFAGKRVTPNVTALFKGEHFPLGRKSLQTLYQLIVDGRIATPPQLRPLMRRAVLEENRRRDPYAPVKTYPQGDFDPTYIDAFDTKVIATRSRDPFDHPPAAVAMIASAWRLGAHHAGPEQHLIAWQLWQKSEQALKTLTPQEEMVLRMRHGFFDDPFHYGKRQTYDEIGRDFEVPLERVRQIDFRACQKLRRHCKQLAEFYDETPAFQRDVSLWQYSSPHYSSVVATTPGRWPWYYSFVNADLMHQRPWSTLISQHIIGDFVRAEFIRAFIRKLRDELQERPGLVQNAAASTHAIAKILYDTTIPIEPHVVQAWKRALGWQRPEPFLLDHNGSYYINLAALVELDSD